MNMNSLSVIASVISILNVALRTTSALVKYTDNTRNAFTERRILAKEATCLLTILQRLQDRTYNKALDLN